MMQNSTIFSRNNNLKPHQKTPNFIQNHKKNVQTPNTKTSETLDFADCGKLLTLHKNGADSAQTNHFKQKNKDINQTVSIK